MVEVRVPPWPGIPSTHGVSRLVAGAPRHLDHRMGRASASFDGKSSFPDGRGASRVRRASRPPAAELETNHRGPDTDRCNRSRGPAPGAPFTSTSGREGHQAGRASASDRQAGRARASVDDESPSLRWSRCEPRAASLETTCAGAGIGPHAHRRSPRTASMVSARSAVLSGRYRRTRANRRATPPG